MEHKKHSLTDTVKDTLQFFVNSDKAIYGHISADTLQAIKIQGYRLNHGVVEKNQSQPFSDKQLVPISAAIMKIDTKTQAFNMQEIENRRFMFNPQTEILVLGRQDKKTSRLKASHAVELAEAGITKDFDNFIRGWIGTGKVYPNGVIHFAPNIDKQNIPLFEKGFSALEMFSANGANTKTIIRGFGDTWEQSLSSILSPDRTEEKKPSLRQKLKKPVPQNSIHEQKSKKQPER